MDSMDQGGIKWGAEIAVDGVRPEWLEGQFSYRAASGVTRWYGPVVGYSGWNTVGAIRLPADHPFYQKQATIDPALVERMVALVRRLADSAPAHLSGPLSHEARDILKALEPVDEDLLEARQCVVTAYEGIGRKDLAEQADSGNMDSRLRVQACLAAIRRGRQLERGEK